MMCIDTQLFLDFFNSRKRSHRSFMDFLEYIYTRDSSMVEKKDDKIIAVCAEIDIKEKKIDFDIVCKGVIFKEKVNFYDCIFEGKVSFKDCTFEKQATFSNSVFENKVYFDNSVFKDYVDFHESNFMNITSFYGVKFQKVPNFSACYFKEQKAVNLVNVDINSLDFKKVENFIEKNYKDKTYDKDIKQNSNKRNEIEQKHQLRYAQNIKDSFRVIKDILIEQNNILEAQEWHKFELYAKENELKITSARKNYKSYPIDENVDKEEYKKISLIRKYLCEIMNKIKNVGRDMQDYTAWINCVLLQLYRNTSDHHTNFLRILHFTIIMISLYALFSISFAKIINSFMSLDSTFVIFIFSYIIYIAMLFLFLSILNKNNFLEDSFIMFFTIFGFIFIGMMTYLSFNSIQVFALMVYFLGIVIFYIFFICKIKIIIFFVRVLSYMVFLGVIILKPQLINPFIGIFSSDKLFESKFEQKLNVLHSNAIINLAKISQRDFVLPNEYQKEHNISFTELNSAKKIILANKIELNSILSYLFDKKKIDNFEKILTTLENNCSDLTSAIKNIDNKNNNSAMFLDMKKMLNLDFIDRIDEKGYSIIRYFPYLSITPKDEEYQIFESQENQTKLKNILSIIKLDDELELQSIKQIMDCDKILSEIIKSTSVIYSIILLLCIFSLQKTARKNSIIPS